MSPQVRHITEPRDTVDSVLLVQRIRSAAERAEETYRTAASEQALEALLLAQTALARAKATRARITGRHK